MSARIGVVVPCLDEADTLAACLEGLRAQTLPASRYEVVVVDGGSHDGSREIARRAGFRVVEDVGRGPGAARNVGIRATTAEIVAFTDADCVPEPAWLESLLDVFASDPAIDGVAGALRLPRSTLLGRLEDNDARLRYRGYITSNVAYRRAALEAVGGFDESLRCCEDYDLAWRLLDAGHRIVHHPGPVVLHDPPEARATVRRYLEKQFWYARNDVPAHARALLRARRDPDARAGGAQAALGGLRALADSALAAGIVGAAVLGRPRAAAAPLLALAAASARDALVGVRRVGGERLDGPRMAALLVAKRLARGAGTLAGLASLATPAGRAVLSAPAGGSLRSAARAQVATTR